MKIFTGKVISKNFEKNATVAVERVVVHPYYKKRVKKIKKYHVHDDIGVKVNQNVKFIDCRPYSKTKRWKIIEIIGVDIKNTPNMKRKKIKKNINLGSKKTGKKVIRKRK